MNGTSVSMLAIATVLLAATAFAQSQSTAQEHAEMQTAQFFVGKWNCMHTVGDFSGTYTTTYTATLDNAWLEQVYDFPATSEGGPVHAQYFLRYDGRIPQWVRFGAHSNAMYFGMVGKRSDNVWSWNYVLPGRTGSVVWTKKSDTEYTVDGPTYPQNGKMVTEHHGCRKV
jgi:hypothetical protein